MMSEDGLSRIKAKFQELTDLIKEETTEETQELKEEILERVNEVKSAVEESIHNADRLGDKIGDNIEEFFGDLEGKALKVKYTIEEKYSHLHKDDIINRTADSLIDAINKAKDAIQSK